MKKFGILFVLIFLVSVFPIQRVNAQNLVIKYGLWEQFSMYSEDEFHLTVNYSIGFFSKSRTLEQMIAAGHYDSKSSLFNSTNFPLPEELAGKTVELSARMFYFNRRIFIHGFCYAEVAAMDKAGYRPATLAELLALGESQPELQKQFPIVVAVGSLWRDDDGWNVPVLSVSGGERKLYLDSFDGDYPGGWGNCSAGCGFLAVRK